MARYSRDLYARLEAETGHSTGFRATGHLHLATNPERLETLRRESALVRGMRCRQRRGLPGRGRGCGRSARTDDVLAGFYVADEGRADPVGCATAMAKGARGRRRDGRRGCAGDRVRDDRGGTLGLWGAGAEGRRVTAVLTDAGRVECETVVLAAGLWSRQVAALAGVDVPLQAAEHYYLLTDPVPGRAPRPAGRRGPGPVRVLPGGGRRHARRPVRAGRRAVARRGCPGRLRVRQHQAGLGPGGRRPRRGDGTGAEPGRRRGADVLLRSGVVHAGPAPDARPGARGRQPLRRRRAELARDPARRRRRVRRRAVGRGRRFRRST